ncbi:hypothetical protein GGF31_007210 [Allomyces arbusculus]|nr:hypothetical protein GGF31_007210 [Allomyces arbusculus]
MTAAYAPGTLVRLANRSTKRLGNVVGGDLLLDAFQRPLRVTNVDRIDVEPCYKASVFYTERNMDEYQGPPILMGPNTSLFLASSCFPTLALIHNYNHTDTSYIGLRMVQRRERTGFATLIATRSLVPGTAQTYISVAELPQEEARIAMLIEQRAGELLYWDLAVNKFDDYIGLNQDHEANTHMVRVPLIGALVRFRHAVALGMRVVVTEHAVRHPISNQPNGFMMRMELKSQDEAPSADETPGAGETIFQLALERLGVFRAKVYGPEVLALLLADNECIRGSAIGGFIDARPFQFSSHLREMARSLGQRTSLFPPTKNEHELFHKKKRKMYLHRGLAQRIEITSIAIADDNVIKVYISRPNRQAAEEPAGKTYFPRRLCREQIQLEVSEVPGKYRHVRIQAELANPDDAPFIYDELSGTTSPHPVDGKLTMVTADNVVLQLAGVRRLDARLVDGARRGNGSKAQQKRERNAKAAGGVAKSQLKVNEAAKNIQCVVCKQTFLGTANLATLNQHAENKARLIDHNKTAADCFPGKA